MNVIVYGTLRKGFGNDGFWTWCGESQPCQIPDIQLYGSGIPYAIPCEGATAVGELITIPDWAAREALQDIDMLEGFGDRFENHYDRIKHQAILSDGSTVTGWLYVAGPWSPAEIAQGLIAPIPSNDYAEERRERYAQLNR